MNQVQSDALDEVLVARAAMYGLLQRVFSDVPDRALAENESCEVMDQCFEVLGEAWGLRDCRTCKVGEGAGPKVPEQDIDAVPLTLEGEYNRLFVGVGKPAVCMWESIYATGINALFQPNTLEVRNVYLRNGFKPLGMGKVADDHMAIELAFMRELALETTRAGEAQRGVAADGAATVSGGAPTSLGRCLRRTGRGARQKRILSRLCPFACRFRGQGAAFLPGASA